MKIYSGGKWRQDNVLQRKVRRAAKTVKSPISKTLWHPRVERDVIVIAGAFEKRLGADLTLSLRKSGAQRQSALEGQTVGYFAQVR